MALPGSIYEDFSQQVAIVTGGSSEIGLSIVEKLSERNAHVVIADLNPPPSLPSRSIFVETDVTSWQSQVNLFRKTVEMYNKIDMVYANAGISEPHDFQHREEETDIPSEPSWRPIVVNLIGSAITTKLGFYFLKKFGGGRIVLTSSLLGYDAHGMPTYAACKHGVVGLMRGLRDFAPPLNITINCLAPGFTETNIFPDDVETTVSLLREAGVPVQSADIVANAALYFASQPSVNGKALAIIGGSYYELEDPLKEAFMEAINGESSNSTRKEQKGKAFEAVEKLFSISV